MSASSKIQFSPCGGDNCGCSCHPCLTARPDVLIVDLAGIAYNGRCDCDTLNGSWILDYATGPSTFIWSADTPLLERRRVDQYTGLRGCDTTWQADYADLWCLSLYAYYHLRIRAVLTYTPSIRERRAIVIVSLVSGVDVVDVIAWLITETDIEPWECTALSLDLSMYSPGDYCAYSFATTCHLAS